MKLRLTLFNFFAVTGLAFGQAQQTNTFGRNIDTPAERQSFREALELWTDDSPTFTGGTYTGNLTVDTNTLHVDSANNRVGVGTNTPSAGYALDVSGNTKITGYLDLDRPVDIYLGELPSAPAFSGIWFAKNSGTATASNYSFLGDGNSTFLNGPITLYLRTGNTTRATIGANGIELAAGDSVTFASNSGSWDGANLKVDTIDETAGNFAPLLDLSAGYLGQYGPHQINFKNGTLDTYNGSTFQPIFDYGSVTLYDYSGTQILDLWSGLTFSGTPTLAGDFSVSGQLEATGQSASTDNSVMTKALVRDFSSVWGDVYKLSNGETDTNNKLSMVYAGDRYFNFSCYTGTAAGDGQWTTFMPQTFGLTYGSGAKGQLRDQFSYKFKFDSNTVTNTDVDLWLIRGKTPNATLPVASDVCFALKFAGEEDLMIAVYDGVTAYTTTIDVSTIDSWFTSLASQQEFMWTWDGTTAKVYGRYRRPTGSGDNDWSAWYTMGSLTPSGMAGSTTNLSYAGLHFLQHTPVTCTAYTKNYIIWDLEHTSHVIAPN